MDLLLAFNFASFCSVRFSSVSSTASLAKRYRVNTEEYQSNDNSYLQQSLSTIDLPSLLAGPCLTAYLSHDLVGSAQLMIRKARGAGADR